MASRVIERLTHDFGQIIDVAWLNRSRCNGAATVKEVSHTVLVAITAYEECIVMDLLPSRIWRQVIPTIREELGPFLGLVTNAFNFFLGHLKWGALVLLQRW